MLCAHYARDPVLYRPILDEINGVSPAPHATEPDPPPVPLPVVRKAQKIGHGACLYATKCGCAGGGARCHHLGRVVTIRDCVRCLENLGLISRQ